MNLEIPEKITESFLIRAKFVAASNRKVFKEFFTDHESEDTVIIVTNIDNNKNPYHAHSWWYNNYNEIMENKNYYNIETFMQKMQNSDDKVLLMIQYKNEQVVKIIHLNPKSGKRDVHIYKNNRRILSI